MVPPMTATIGRRPGTRAIICSMALTARKATPVCSSTSPIRMKSGIGARVKLVNDAIELRATWASPASPPRKRTAPRKLTAMNEKGTGRPIISRTHIAPSMMPIAQPHAITMASLPYCRRGTVRATEAQDELDRQQQARHGDDDERPPFGKDDALEHHAAERLRRQGDLDAVPQENEADGEADEVGERLEQRGATRRQRGRDDVDTDMGALAQDPGRGEKRAGEEPVFDGVDEPGKAGAGEVAQGDVEGDQRRAYAECQADAIGQTLDDPAVHDADALHRICPRASYLVSNA